ncbi:hypothetical protein [Tumebacillus flagellatus]|uniref:Uncharacterized protein n=1 Tax=Tumebacillus flagellatus TaxID=1157490 RepID=A0A074LTQ2_9BACL|nr:hypothetical protein [Tumebacillus flagellatus]KEO83995.1 hypothetical protein EL26_07365 [Tumebacillus flagellatus]
MTLFTQLSDIQQHLSTGNLQALEACLNDTTRAVSLEDYQAQLEKGLHRALQLAKRTFAQAVYFEYDLDNNWDSSFTVCKEYYPLEADNEDWAAPGPGTRDFPGPSLPAFAELYTDFDTPETLSLIAATVLVFAKACRTVQSNTPQNLKLCIAFHGQDPIFRL